LHEKLKIHVGSFTKSKADSETYPIRVPRDSLELRRTLLGQDADLRPAMQVSFAEMELSRGPIRVSGVQPVFQVSIKVQDEQSPEEEEPSTAETVPRRVP
jgi:hypothetical protein